MKALGARIIGSGGKIWRLYFLSITFKLGCCGSKIRVADNFNHNKNITLKFAAAAATLVTDQVVQTRVCCVSVPVYNFNPNSPNACVCVCVAESVSSPNSPGSSATSELAKCRSSRLSRQMPNLILMPDPIILGHNASRHVGDVSQCLEYSGMQGGKHSLADWRHWHKKQKMCILLADYNIIFRHLIKLFCLILLTTRLSTCKSCNALQ